MSDAPSDSDDTTESPGDIDELEPVGDPGRLTHSPSPPAAVAGGRISTLGQWAQRLAIGSVVLPVLLLLAHVADVLNADRDVEWIVFGTMYGVPTVSLVAILTAIAAKIRDRSAGTTATILLAICGTILSIGTLCFLAMSVVWGWLQHAGPG